MWQIAFMLKENIAYAQKQAEKYTIYIKKVFDRVKIHDKTWD